MIRDGNDVRRLGIERGHGEDILAERLRDLREDDMPSLLGAGHTVHATSSSDGSIAATTLREGLEAVLVAMSSFPRRQFPSIPRQTSER